MNTSLSPKEIRNRIKNAIKLGLSTQEIEELAAMLRKHKSSTNVFSKEINTMIKKSGRDRYIYSIKRIADQKTAWTLKNNDGILKTADEENNDYFHIWPFKEYALKCAVDEWAGFELHRISLADLLNVILPNLSATGTQIAVFKSPHDPLITSVSADVFLNNLLHESAQFS